MSCTGPLVFRMLDTLDSFAEAVGRRKLRTCVGVEKPDGSSGATVNSPAGGMLRVKRVTARLIVSSNVALRACLVEMSASGRLPSSTRLNNGARPSESLNNSLFASAVMVQPWSGAWQVAQLRGFVPSARKNGLVKSIAPAVWNVSATP
jgi:hypothetical protein